jgi:hypothetical protein
VFTYAQTSRGSTTTPLDGCTASLGSGQPMESTTATCSGGGRSPNATIELSAHSTAPTSPDHLAELGASAHITVDTSKGFSDPLVSDFLSSGASASFRDYVHIGDVRPADMVFSFQLSGTFGVGDAPFYPLASAGTILGFYAQSGTYSGGGFSSTSPFSTGQSQVTTHYTETGQTTSTFNDPSNASDFQLVLDPAGLITLTLGPSFFANPTQSDVLLQFDLAAIAELTYAFPGQYPLFADADFSHTLLMTGVHAFDSSGQDITADAFGGFASNGNSVAPVPEPGSASLLAVGLAVVAGLQGRRRRRI